MYLQNKPPKTLQRTFKPTPKPTPENSNKPQKNPSKELPKKKPQQATNLQTSLAKAVMNVQRSFNSPKFTKVSPSFHSKNTRTRSWCDTALQTHGHPCNENRVFPVKFFSQCGFFHVELSILFFYSACLD